MNREIQNIVDELNKKKINIFLNQNELRYKAPEGVLDQDLRNRMQQNKNELILYLQRERVRPLIRQAFRELGAIWWDQEVDAVTHENLINADLSNVYQFKNKLKEFIQIERKRIREWIFEIRRRVDLWPEEKRNKMLDLIGIYTSGGHTKEQAIQMAYDQMEASHAA